MGIERVSEHVYANVDWDGANVACIDTTEGSVLVDTPMLPKDIEQWKVFVHDLNPRGIRYIIATHSHFDHIIGCNQLGAPVIMHERGRDSLFEENATLRESMAGLGPERTKEEVDFILSEKLVPSEITMGSALTLNLGDTTLGLHHVGGHSVDSVIVYLVEEKLLFTGDNITSARHPYKGHACFADWIRALEYMDTFDVQTVIPGHGALCGPSEIKRFIDYLRTLWHTTSELVSEGVTGDDLIRTVNDKLFNYFETEPERLEAASVMFNVGTKRLIEEIQSEQR